MSSVSNSNVLRERHVSTEMIAAAEVAWYRRKGLYPQERIKNDADGNPYVVGDWCWNRGHPYHPEVIEPKMARQGVYG